MFLIFLLWLFGFFITFKMNHKIILDAHDFDGITATLSLFIIWPVILVLDIIKETD